MKKLTTSLFFLSLTIFTIVTITPILGEKINKLLYATIVGTFFVTAFVYNRYIKSNMSKIVLCYLFACIQVILYKAIGYSSCSWNYVFLLCITYLVFFLPPLFVNDRSVKLDKLFVVLFIIIVSVNIVDNIRLLILYPGASEIINFDYGEEYKSMNVGGTGFVNFVVFFGLFLMMIIQCQKKYHFVLWLLFLISFVYVVMSGRAISVLTFFICSLILILYGIKGVKKNKVSFLSLFLMFILILVNNIEFISDLLELILESDRLSSRLQETATFGQSSESSGSSSDRLYLYSLSIKTFFSSVTNFVFGVGDELSEGQLMYKKGIGMHSAMLDYAAKYGIIGLFFLVSFFIMSYSSTYKKVKKIYPPCKVIFYAYIINIFLNNNVTIPCLFLIFIIIPSYLLILNQNIINNASKETTKN